MKILIDARLYGLEHAGIGRYVMELLNQLSKIDKVNEYLILLRNETQHKFSLKNSNFKFQIVDIPHYSLKEQLELPKIIANFNPDLVHFPHFNIPIFFNKPYILTIHDLIKHTSRGSATTTRSPLLYWPKYAGYKVVFDKAVKKAKKIIVPSQTVKDELLKEYTISPDKVVVIYEGVDEIFSSKLKVLPAQAGQSEKLILEKYKIRQPYVIYTGNAYPHKNLERLIQAIKHLNDLNHLNKPITLVIVSSRNVFLDRVVSYARKYNAEKFVIFAGFVPDKELSLLYKNAKAFVFPSLSEGFGLPGLEAMAAGCPVICSDIPVFHEIYKDAAIYFNPYDVNEIASKINEVIHFDDLNHRTIVEKGKKRANQFSWRKMAEETLEVYTASHNLRKR